MSLLDILEFEAPLSRVEEILQNVLGASNEVDPESRVEKLLQNLIEVAYEVDPDSRVELLLDNLLGGHNEVVPMSRVEMLIANALGESYDVVPQSRVEELLVLLAEQYAVEYKTVSGSVVSISDALEAPMKSLKVAIEPVQDLHGYENPYPAGGGKNKFDPNSENHNWVGVDDVISQRDTCKTCNFPIASGASVTLSNANPSSATNILLLAFFDSNDTLLSRHPLTTGATYITATAPENTAYVLASFFMWSEASYAQLELGSTATSYAPYSNICSISGWTGAQVVRTGKNLFDVHFDKTVAGNTYLYVLKLKPNTQYTCSSDIPISDSASVYFGGGSTNTNGVFNGAPKTMTADANGCISIYVRFNYTIGHDINMYQALIDGTQWLQVEEGTTASDYEPYTAQSVNVSWETEAGTVYGGTLDVVSGELVVDRASVDLGTLTWNRTTSYSAPMFYSKIAQKRISNMSMRCSMYKYSGNFGSAVGFANHSENTSIGNGNENKQIFVRDDSYTDAATFKSALDGIQLVYDLAEPITYHLTPTEVRTLLGQNNVWADTGDVEVTYLTKKH